MIMDVLFYGLLSIGDGDEFREVLVDKND